MTDRIELPRNLSATLEVYRASSDESLQAMCRWFMTDERLVQWAVERIVQDFRARAPAPKQRPSITWV